MKIAPDLPAPVPVAGNALEVKVLAGIKPSRPVQERTLPPLVVQPHSQREGQQDTADQPERRYEPHIHGERRTYCRRIEHLPILIELRSVVDRRRHNQRRNDTAEHIDVEV
ncbi:MAG: hypothetical protein NUV75_08910 [Gallionella sp.]|nr:hypothetical protein [Gallionella sp.]